jgi:hypothetical protein
VQQQARGIATGVRKVAQAEADGIFLSDVGAPSWRKGGQPGV